MLSSCFVGSENFGRSARFIGLSCGVSAFACLRIKDLTVFARVVGFPHIAGQYRGCSHSEYDKGRGDESGHDASPKENLFLYTNALHPEITIVRRRLTAVNATLRI